MNFNRIKEKLNSLAVAARYNVSFSSSSCNHKNKAKGLGNLEIQILQDSLHHQTNWLLAFWAKKILHTEHPNLDMNIDPKLMWPLRKINSFLVDINKTNESMLARLLDMGSFYKILNGMKFRCLNLGLF